MNNPVNPDPHQETSIWEFLISKINFWDNESSPLDAQNNEPQSRMERAIPWLTLTASGLAFLAQLSLEPSPDRSYWPGLVLYSIAACLLFASILKGEWRLPDLKPESNKLLEIHLRLDLLLVGIILACLSFLLFGSGLFNLFNLAAWVLSLWLIFTAFKSQNKPLIDRIRKAYRQFNENGWVLKITNWTVIVLAVIAVILFFNFYQLEAIPPEMISDHAEKLMDINDILHGYTPVYFIRNTGREVLHFYLTAAYLRLFNLDVNFLNLKFVAVLANLLTIFFIYLLGNEMGNKRAGLAAALFAGIAYWPLVFTRLALRIPYYPLFVAPVLFLFVRGLRRQKINDLLWCGIFLGLGLHGYTPFRIVPIFIVLGIFVYGLHQSTPDRRKVSIIVLILIAFVSLVVFMPLLCYWITNPRLFGFRAFSRLGQIERMYPQHPVLIFIQNFWKASLMFFWDNGIIWVHSVPGRPALEVVSGALYFLGILSLIIRYFQKRSWMDLIILLSIPMLLMPSILSLAFPSENPSLNRTAGAVVPVFVVIGLASETLIRSVTQSLAGRISKTVWRGVIIGLVIWSGINNFNLVFDEYYTITHNNILNSSKIGNMAALFIESIGTPETTFVVGYPHWVDSRSVAINAGYTGMDFVIQTDQIHMIAQDPRAKIFFMNIHDIESVRLLQELFPTGNLSQYYSEVPNRDFLIFLSPSTQGVIP